MARPTDTGSSSVAADELEHFARRYRVYNAILTADIAGSACVSGILATIALQEKPEGAGCFLAAWSHVSELGNGLRKKTGGIHVR